MKRKKRSTSQRVEHQWCSRVTKSDSQMYEICVNQGYESMDSNTMKT